MIEFYFELRLPLSDSESMSFLFEISFLNVLWFFFSSEMLIVSKLVFFLFTFSSLNRNRLSM